MTDTEVRGCAVQIESVDGAVRRYRRHPNGGGLVEVSATVAESATVHESAYVESGSVLGDGTHVGPGCWIESGARIGTDVTVGQNAHLGSGTRIGDGARIGANARLGTSVVVAAGARVAIDARVADRGACSPPTPGAQARTSRPRPRPPASALAASAAALISSASTLSIAFSTIASALTSALRISTAPGSETSADQPGVPGGDRALELLGQLLAVLDLAGLAGRRTDGTQHRGAPDDRRREDQPERDATDDAPGQAVPGAVVGRLLDLQGPVRGAVDDDDAVDLDRPAVLDRLERLVRCPCRPCPRTRPRRGCTRRPRGRRRRRWTGRPTWAATSSIC